MAEKRTEVAQPEGKGLVRRESSADIGSPFRMLERFADEMDRVFDDFGFGRGLLAPRIGRGFLRSPSRGVSADWEPWTPQIEVFHRNNELVRAG